MISLIYLCENYQKIHLQDIIVGMMKIMNYIRVLNLFEILMMKELEMN